jgi:hypothetical protein
MALPALKSAAGPTLRLPPATSPLGIVTSRDGFSTYERSPEDSLSRLVPAADRALEGAKRNRCEWSPTP